MFRYAPLLFVSLIGLLPGLSGQAPSDALPIDSAKAVFYQEIDLTRQWAGCTMQRVVSTLEDQIEAADDPVAAWNEHPDLRRWFGRIAEPGDTLAVHRFADLMRQIQTRLASDTLRLIIDDDPKGYCRKLNSNAYTLKSAPVPTIYFCDAWLAQKQRQRSSTFIHELMHTFGYSHPKNTDSPSEAIMLARTHPHLARQSPENLEGLVELWFCFRLPRE